MNGPDVTRLLHAAATGDLEAAERLLPAVYEELRQLARRHLHHDRATIEPTALVHEVWLRICSGTTTSWNHRGHFFGAASQAMRRILVEHARSRSAKKRALPGSQTGLAEISANHVDCSTVLDVHAALTQLEQERPREAQLVLLRYFGGLEMSEIASLLQESVGTIERDWRLARARLQRLLSEPPPTAP